MVFDALLNEVSIRNLRPKKLRTLRWKFEEIFKYLLVYSYLYWYIKNLRCSVVQKQLMASSR